MDVDDEEDAAARVELGDRESEDWRTGKPEWCRGRMLDMVELWILAVDVWWSNVGPGGACVSLFREAEAVQPINHSGPDVHYSLHMHHENQS